MIILRNCYQDGGTFYEDTGDPSRGPIASYEEMISHDHDMIGAQAARERFAREFPQFVTVDNQRETPVKVFVVMVNSANYDWFLRATTWTSDPARATKFNDRREAGVALEKARKFTRPALFKSARVVEAPR